MCPARLGASVVAAMPLVLREFTKGVLVKGSLAIYAFPLCKCNTLGCVSPVQL